MAYYYSQYSQGKKKKNPFRKWTTRILLLLILAALGAGYLLYEVVSEPNIWTPNGKPVGINIPSGTTFAELKHDFYSRGLIIHRKSFEWWAGQKKLPKLIKPGHYIIYNGWSNNQLINLLRSGKQSPVKVTFNNVRNIYDLAGKIGRQIEPDSASLVQLLTDSAYIAKMGLNEYTIPVIFIPNTYQVYWTITTKEFVERMYQEYLKFWNPERRKLAKAQGLSPEQVVVLASIVQKETNDNAEKPEIASVYLNRLNMGWRLQADPTVIFALRDYSIHRVLNVQKKVDSPYNTYIHRGLPPGPICMPSISSVEAVLNPAKTDYMYFCAKDDLSGSHVFSKNSIQHMLNAKKYQDALDKMKIYR
jgi:UPF0755 protein